MNQVTRAAANALAICHFSFLPLFMYCHYRISESLRLPQAACSLHLVAGGLQRSRIPLSCKERSSRNAFGSTPGSPRPMYSPSHNSRTAARPGSPPHARARVAPRSVHYEGLRSLILSCASNLISTHLARSLVEPNLRHD